MIAMRFLKVAIEINCRNFVAQMSVIEFLLIEMGRRGAELFIVNSLSMYKIKHFIEWQVFGVCTAIGEKMGIATSEIRRYFIYISFLTLGSPVIFYMILAFWMNVKNYIKNSRRNPLRYL
jgi:phage shock protein PspC (stress-responsive transcriptional regulator)